MNLYKYLISYVIATAVFFAVDMLWLGFIARNFYRQHLATFLHEKVNWTAAIIFYLIFIVGIFIFAVMPALEKGSYSKAILLGALFGFFTYATYDLTNLATLKDWPLTVVFVDIAWGAFLTSVVSLAGYSAMRWIS